MMNRGIQIAVSASLAVSMLCLTVFLCHKVDTDPYTKEREYTCRILEKVGDQHASLIGNGGFILVLSSEGKVFSQNVTPAVWAAHDKGDTLCLTLAPCQLDDHWSEPVTWILWDFISLLVTVGMWIRVIQLVTTPDTHDCRWWIVS